MHCRGANPLVGRRFSVFLLAGFALATLLLATAGVYGVMSFSTSQRMREFGVRMALGAERRDIVGLVVRDGLILAGTGGGLLCSGAPRAQSRPHPSSAGRLNAIAVAGRSRQRRW